MCNRNKILNFCLTLIFCLLAMLQVHIAKAAGINMGLPIPGQGDTVSDFPTYANAMYDFGRIAASVLAVLMIGWGGFKYITSQGNADQTNDAKEIVISAISGVLLLIFSGVFLKWLLP